MRLLLIEDDPFFGAAVRDGLVLAGHEVDWLTGCAGVEEALAARPYDSVLLDLGLPDGDGAHLLRTLRARGHATPVLVMSARGQVEDRVSLIDQGADDYLVKPLDLTELCARLRAIMRRGAAPIAPSAGALEHGSLRLDPTERRVTWKGSEIDLRHKEYALLEIFMRSPQSVFTRAQLEGLLYGEVAPVDSNALEVHVHHLRRKIAKEVVVTERGAGYRLGGRHLLV